MMSWHFRYFVVGPDTLEPEMNLSLIYSITDFGPVIKYEILSMCLY